MFHAIRQLEEKNVANEMDILLWSDRMDLVAFSNIKGEVALHRLTWTRAWSLGPKKDGYAVKGLAWRPDGKVLAIGYSSGDVLLVNVENKNTLNSLKVSGEIRCISWAHEKVDDKPVNIFESAEEERNDYMKHIDCSSTYLPDVPSLTSFDSNAAEESNKTNFFHIQSELNLLLIGTKEGLVYISIFGCFPFSIVDLNKHLGYKCELLNIHLSDNLSMMFATIQNDKGIIEIVVLQTDIFKTHTKELFSMALKQQHLNSLLSYISCTIETIKETWENILLEMDSKLSKYASKVPEGTLAADFLDLLMFGVSSENMQQFLLRDLTKKGLEKFGQTIEMSYANIQKLILKNITKVGQNITYHLAELQGMARLEHKYQKIGLKEKPIVDAIAENGSFLTKGGEIQQIINNSMINYKAFFRWLYTAIMHLMEEQVPPEIPKMTQQDLACINDFLQNFDSIHTSNGGNHQKGFSMERLGQYLTDSNLTIPLDMSKNEWSSLLEQNKCLHAHPSIIKHKKDLSLVQQYNLLVEALQEVFEEPKMLIADQFKLYKTVTGLQHDSDLPVSYINSNDRVTCVTFLSEKAPSEGLYIIEITYADSFVAKAVFLFFEQYQSSEVANVESLPVLDVKFYSVNVLSVLLQANTTKTAILYQFPLPLIREKLTEIDIERDLSLQSITRINGCSMGNISMKRIDGMVASKFAVSGNRKVAIVLSENKRKVRLFEMEADEDEEEDAEMTNSTIRESDNSMQEHSDD